MDDKALDKMVEFTQMVKENHIIEIEGEELSPKQLRILLNILSKENLARLQIFDNCIFGLF